MKAKIYDFFKPTNYLYSISLSLIMLYYTDFTCKNTSKALDKAQQYLYELSIGNYNENVINKLKDFRKMKTATCLKDAYPVIYSGLCQIYEEVNEYYRIIAESFGMKTEEEFCTAFYDSALENNRQKVGEFNISEENLETLGEILQDFYCFIYLAFLSSDIETIDEILANEANKEKRREIYDETDFDGEFIVELYIFDYIRSIKNIAKKLDKE